MIKTLIVEDEKISATTLQNYLKDYCDPSIDIIGIASSVKEASEMIRKEKPDLIFLDVRLGDGSGFDILKEFKKPAFRVIFTTGFDQYALEAFRFHAVNYLLKPVSVDELTEAVDLVVAQISKEHDYRNISAMLDHLPKTHGNIDELYIRHHIGFDVLKINEIIYCQADGGCTYFYTSAGKKIVSSKSLGYYEDLLTDKNFIRVHHSYLVNRQHINGYHHEGVIQVTGKMSVPLGDVYRKKFLEQYRN
jgi:two-component system, LytTR family, response regulator